MKCILCENLLYDKFNNNYIISFCDSCKLEHTTLDLFKNIILSYITFNYPKIKDKYKNIMTDNFIKNFCQEKFGLINKVEICKLNKNCDGSVKSIKRGECYIYQYNYYGFKFYYCFYQKLIVYNAEDIDILINNLYKFAKKENFKIKLNKILTFIKNLFIKENKKEGIEEDVKK